MGGSLDGHALDASQAATIIMLASMVFFTVQYLIKGTWKDSLVGWSIVIERIGFVALLALLVVQEYWPPSLPSQNDFLWAEAILLVVAAVGVNAGNWVMVRIARKRTKAAQKALTPPARAGKGRSAD